ncbi:MAG: ATP-binding protein [Saprospiraceae bacterium]|nr:ATP-binding protein [Saprospiraceae bacterium]HRD82143.1 AAA family ATPase [Saprospiraceae bacterium]
MIRLVETKNFRSLRYLSQPLDDFHVLVGANASGKTTFLDVISFIADLVNSGIDYAITQRTQNYTDLTFAGRGGDIELAIEMEIPKHLAGRLPDQKYDRIRYAVRIGLTNETKEHAIHEERVLLLNSELALKNTNGTLRINFPEYYDLDRQLLKSNYNNKQYKQIIKKQEGGNDNFYPESRKDSGGGWIPSFKLGIKKSALGNLPADETKFPVSSWLKNFLIEGIQLFILDSLNIRRASPPGQSLQFKTDGSNLPWVVEELKKRDIRAYRNWIEHLRTALPDIEDIYTVERPDDRHRYLKVRYNNNMEVPSWLVSDGTLRLLALTLPAYLPDFTGVYLIEEPENGIHPKAIETVYQSLSSVYGAQILLASHSPVILSMVELSQVLCFGKTSEGVTDIVKGIEHPKLLGWRGETNLSILFAGGVLS